MMTPPQQRSVTIALWAVLVLVMTGVLGFGVWSHYRDGKRLAAVESGLPVMFHAPAFSLISQAGTQLSDKDLRGHIYIADFVFTQCAGPCPLMTQKMAGLQTAIADRRVRFVSFSVDPMHDTPAVLTAYAKQAGADPARWSFVTGDQQAIFDVARGMKITAERNPEGVLHATYFLLIDSQGQVRGVYDAQGETADQRLKQLVDDVAKLSAERNTATASNGGRSS